MKPVMQTLLYEDGHFGNCLAACIASILEIPIDGIPEKFIDLDPKRESWWTGLQIWSKENGYSVTRYNDHEPPGYSIVTGESPRTKIGGGHCVVWYFGGVSHDPHPSGIGVASAPYNYVTIEKAIAHNYSVRDGCHNCKHVFVYREYDEPDYYHCTLNALPRPPCDSNLMDELALDGPPFDEFVAKIEVWMDWAETQLRDRAGKCDDWKSNKEDST